MATPDENELLSPYQRLLEQQQAPIRRAGAAEQAAYPWSPETNPLVTGPATGIAPTGTETAAASGAPNPWLRPQSLAQLPTPPVPLSAMPVAQRLAWQKLNDDQIVAQANLDKTQVDTETARAQIVHRAEQLRQSKEMVAELPKLQKALAEGGDYLAAKTELVKKFPLGASSLEGEKILSPFDQTYTKQAQMQDLRDRAEVDRQQRTLGTRITEGYAEATKLGPEVRAQFAAEVDKNPEEALRKLGDITSVAQRRNLEVQLAEGGLTPEQIEEKYGGGATGKPFAYQAAEKAMKTSAALDLATQRATTNYSTLNKMRMESYFDPVPKKNPDGTLKDPYKDSKGWTPQLEGAWQNAQNEVNVLLTPKTNRAGVVDIGRYPPYERESAYARQLGQPTPTPTATPTPTPTPTPTATPTPTPIVVPVTAAPTQMQIGPTGYPIQAPPTLTPTPDQELVGARKLINGVESVKLADGKWYKVKQKT